MLLSFVSVFASLNKKYQDGTDESYDPHRIHSFFIRNLVNVPALGP